MAFGMISGKDQIARTVNKEPLPRKRNPINGASARPSQGWAIFVDLPLTSQSLLGIVGMEDALMDSTRLLTPSEVAEMLQVTDNTVTAWLREGRLKGLKVGIRAWRIRPSDLQSFLDQAERSVAA
jgi:excisionase family DNA binding protein